MNLVELTGILGNIGEFIGSIAVVVTLVYLAIQLRQNTHALNETRRIAIANANVARNDMIERSLTIQAQSNEIASILVKFETQGLESLTQVEARRLRAWERARMVRHESLIVQWQQGLLDEALFQHQFMSQLGRITEHWRRLGLEVRNPDLAAAVAQTQSASGGPAE